jgi:hypothetical protein
MDIYYMQVQIYEWGKIWMNKKKKAMKFLVRYFLF